MRLKYHSDVAAFGNMMERLEALTVGLDIVEGQYHHSHLPPYPGQAVSSFFVLTGEMT